MLDSLATSESPSRPAQALPEDWRAVWLGVGLFIAGSGVLYVLPAYVGGVSAALKLTGSQIGFLSAIEIGAVGVSSVLVGLTLAKTAWRRRLLLCLAVCVTGNLLVGLAPSVGTLYALRFATGFFGEGPLFALGCVALSAARDPDRAYGLALGAVGLLGAAVMGTPWSLIWPLPCGGEMAPFALVSAIVLLAWAWSPLTFAAPQAPAQRGGAKRYGAVDLLAAQAIWFAGPGVFWAFADRAGATMGYREALIGRALSVASLAGLAGCFAPILVGDRWGRLKPIGLATAGVCLSVALFQGVHHPAALFVGLAGFMLFWNVAGVYQPALIGACDRSGRAPAFVPISQLLGQAGGPALAGLIVDRLGTGALTGAVTAFCVLGAALFLVFARRGRA